MGEVCSCFSDDADSGISTEQLDFLKQDTKFMRRLNRILDYIVVDTF